MKLFEKTSKILAKQSHKYDRILEAAYQLFVEQGFEEVSIQEIADRADVAKGTFYLYFRDKEELKECVITQKSNELFQRALNAVQQTNIRDFEGQIIFIIDYIMDVLSQNKEALKLISKNLSFGVLNRKMNTMFTDEKADIVQILISAAEKNNIQLKNPRILLFMIIELASSTCFSCILESEPLEMSVFKPYLFDAIRQLIRSQEIQPQPVNKPSRDGILLASAEVW